jgi:hypothetical protein
LLLDKKILFTINVNDDLSNIKKIPNWENYNVELKFNDKPDLEEDKWLKRMDLSDVIFFEKWNNKDNSNWVGFKNYM